MNTKLIFALSLFGLPMAFASYIMPFSVELIFLLVIFIVYAYPIAKNAHGKYFLHGFVISTLGCVWMTLAGILCSIITTGHYDANPYWPAMVLIFGIVLGGFSFIASRVFAGRIA